MEPNKPLGYMLGRSLRVFINRTSSEFRKNEIELTFEQYVILHMLNSPGNLIQQDLAKHLQKDKSIIVRQINILLESQYVARHTNQEDKRKKNLVLTKKGIERLSQMKEIAFEVSDKLLSGISETELQIFRNVLSKIRENGGFEDETIHC